MESIILDDIPNSSSTPIKQSDSLKEIYKLRSNKSSVEDLLQAINKNIPTTSLDYLETINNNSISLNTSENSDDASPIKPLNLKQQSSRSMNSLLVEDINEQENDDRIMQDIPKVPSFDELEYNTRINRTLSLSKLHGPRQLNNTSIKRSPSGKLHNSESSKSISSVLLTRDNSPSKKSVCFEESPPKIMEYQALTPEHSDESYGTESSSPTEDKFEPRWDANIKSTFHPLPPLPPKHAIPSIPVATSPQKETTLGSSDEDSQEFNLTKEELLKDKLTLEERLDLVLDNEEISERVQHDESFRGSGSPLRSMTKKEEEFVYNVKTKKELEDEQCLRDAAELFENDVRNDDKDSKILRLNPALKRKNSNNSLKDEERLLRTDSQIINSTPMSFKNYSTEDLISQSTMDSYASASEIMTKPPQLSLKSSDSNTTIQSLNDNATPTKSHKKSISLSNSISNGISFISSIIHKRSDSKEVKLENPPEFKLSAPSLDHAVKIEAEQANIPSTPVNQETDYHIPGTFTSTPQLSSPIDQNVNDSELSSLDAEDFTTNAEVLETSEPIDASDEEEYSAESLKSNIEEDKVNLDEPVDIPLIPEVNQEEMEKELIVNDIPDNINTYPSKEEESSDLDQVVNEVPFNHSELLEDAVKLDTSVPTIGEEQNTDTFSDSQSIQSSIDIHIEPSASEAVKPPNEGLSLLNNQTREASPLLPSHEPEIDLQDFALQSPVGEFSFADEFKGTALFNSSDVLDEDYRTLPTYGSPYLDEDTKDSTSEEKSNMDEAANNTSDKDLLPLIEDTQIVTKSTLETIEPSAAMESEYTTNTGRIVESIVTYPSLMPAKPNTISEHIKEEHSSSLGNITQPVDQISPEEDKAYIKLENTDNGFPEDNQLKELIAEEYSSLRPAQIKPEQNNGTTLPSFNSLLFHDKEPEEDSVFYTPPTDYISIWHSQPKSTSPKPQYSVKQRKVTPPKKVLKLLKRTINDVAYNDEDSELSIQVKEESTRTSIDLSRIEDSFVPTSISKSSYINLDSSKRNSLNYDIKKDPDSSTFSASYMLGGQLLPDTTASSDFANAFRDWELGSTTPDNSFNDLAVQNNVYESPVKEIWAQSNGSNEPSRTPSVDRGKIHTIIAQSIPNGEQAHVRSSNAIAEEVVVVNNDVEGVEVEFVNGDSMLTSSEEVARSFRQVESNSSDYKLAPAAEVISSNRNSAIIPKRLVSTGSTASSYDLNQEFEKALNLQYNRDVASVPNENPKVNQFKKQFIPKLNQPKTNKPKVLQPLIKNSTESLRIPKQSTINTFNEPEFASNIVGSRVISDTDKSTVPGSGSNTPQNRIVSAARSDDNFNGGSLQVKKRENNEEFIPIERQDQVKLPSSDKGRLYCHVGSLNKLILDELRAHKATFKLYVDNGKHIISTSKLTLDHNVFINKEFEIAIENESTELFFTLKVSYNKPENELVEIYEKIPVNNNRFSKIFKTKPKYKLEKKFVTRKKEKDSWDNKFANDGSFGKNKIIFNASDNAVTGKTHNYVIELFNEWTTDEQAGKTYKRDPYLIGKLDITMLYIPRTSPLENLPPSIKIANTIADHLIEQSNIKYSGYLYQEGGDCDLWKRRYFTVEGTKLIAHHESTRKKRAQINLLKVVEIIHSGQKKANSDNRRTFTDEVLMSDSFKLAFRNGEIINMNAETTETKIEWIKVLERVVELNKFHQPWVKLLVDNRK